MADWSLPALASTYTNALTEIKNRDTDLALQFDGTSSAWIPTGAIRWTSSANTWQRWTGSAWGALSSTFAFPAITISGNVSAAAFIPTGGTAPTNGMYLAGTGQVGIAAGGFTPLLIAGGNAGFGTSLPGYAVDIQSADTTAYGYALRLRTNPTSNSAGIQFADATATTQFGAIIVDTGSNLKFSTADTERLRINSNGAISLGSSGSNTGTTGQAMISQGASAPPTWGSFPSLTGTGASGTWGINVTGSSASCTGNAATASALTTASGSAPSYSARAWVNFDGTTATPSTIRGSGNVSSVTKNGTGDYTVNFATAMVDTNYALAGSADWTGANRGQNISPQTFAAGSIRFWSNRGYDGSGWSLQDPAYVNVAIFR